MAAEYVSNCMREENGIGYRKVRGRVGTRHRLKEQRNRKKKGKKKRNIVIKAITASSVLLFCDIHFKLM